MPQHVHKYQRVGLGRSKSYLVYKCTLPGCTHFVQTELVIGRKSICWRCGKEFVITRKLMHKKPHCEDCIQGKSAKVGQRALEVLGLGKAFVNVGGRDLTKAATQMLKALIMRPDHKRKRASLISDLYFEADVTDIDPIVGILAQAGVLETSKEAGRVVYLIKQTAVQQLESLIHAEGPSG